MEFSLALLRSFLEVSRRGSFTLAATSLHITQAAISTQIHVLEESIGLMLIDRSERPLKLTEAGQIFLQFAEETLNKAEGLSNFFRELAGGVAGEVRIGAGLSVGTYVLPKIIGSILRTHPKLKMNLFTQNRETVCAAVAQSPLDFGIVLSDEAPRELQITPLPSELFCLVAGRNHPFVKKGSVSVEELKTTPFVVGMSTGYTEMVDRLLRLNGLTNYPIGFRISNFEGRKECVRAGVGVTILPEFTVADEIRKKTLARIKLKGIQLSGRIMLIENRRNLTSPTVQLVKQLIVSNIQGDSAKRASR